MTLDPPRRCFLAPGLCEITRPFLACEFRWPILPVRQCACRSLRRAVLSDLPTTFGTMQSRFCSVFLTTSKVAVTDVSELGVIVQVPVPEQAPDQPAKAEPTSGVAVSVTGAAVNDAEQVAPQATPDGLEVTDPEPLPVFEIVNVLVTRYRASSNSFCTQPLGSAQPATSIFPSG